MNSSRRSFRIFLTTAVCAFPFAQLTAEVLLPNIFSDHMVLQRGQSNRIWGKASPSEVVTVTIADQIHQVVASEAGTWEVVLDPLEVGPPLELAVRGSNELKIKDILVGEVWVCAGQSNMRWEVRKAANYDVELLTADFPEIRMINFPNQGSTEPIWSHSKAKWVTCSPETVGRFSAVGYYFGRQIHEIIHAPVGLINNSWGGASCETWIDIERLKSDEMTKPLVDRYDQEARKITLLKAKANLTADEERKLTEMERFHLSNKRPSTALNGVLKSHIGYGIRGVAWYQGESNTSRAYQYRTLFPMLIESWRDGWQQGAFPFYWVQLADHRKEQQEPVESEWAELREAQSLTQQKVPNTGQAVIIDLGEGNNIHPTNKREVGLRLARWALARDYGIDVPCQSPVCESVQFKAGRANLKFSDVDGGWNAFDTNTPKGFAIAGEDKKFEWAQAKILEDDSIEVWSDHVQNPIAVRYAWANNPICNLYDQAGLPLTPFRTDDWAGATSGRR